MTTVPAEALYDLTRVTDVAVSPAGDRVAVLTKESDPNEDERVNSLWVVPADGSRDPHRLTRASDAGSPAWSPDGSKLGFIAAREQDAELRVGRDGESETEDDDADDTDEGGGDDEDDDDAAGDDGEDEAGGSDEGPKPQVWYFDVALGGDARQVTDRDQGVESFDWGPDSDRVVVAARDPTESEQEHLNQRKEGGPIEIERLQHKFDGAGYLDEVTTYLFVVNVESREETRIDDANDGGYGFAAGLAPAWGPGGRIAFTANHTDWPDDNYVSDVYTIAPDGSDRRQLTDGELGAAEPTWSPGGDRLAFVGRPPENWYVPTEAYVADVEAGEYESVSGDLDRTLAWGGSPEWLDDERLVALIGDGGRSRLVRLHADGDPERVFDVQGRMETLGRLAAGGGTIAFETSRPDGGGVDALDAAHLDTTEPDTADSDATGREDTESSRDDRRTRLTAFDEELLDDLPTPGCERVTFESEDGTTVEGFVYHPESFDPAEPEPRGLVLDIHGGPMTYDAPSFSFQNAYFTSRGYLVLEVNYRGSTSYGRAFCEVLRGNWGTVDVDDLQAGVDHLLDRGWADSDRLFATGFSQGGINTAYLVTRDDRFAAAAAEHGIYDLRASFGTDDSQNWLEADFGLPWENPEAYDEHSSITEVGGIETPLLVTAGENDWRCPPSQAEQLYVSVRKQGVDAKLVVYQDEHHNVGDPDRAVHRLETLDGWFSEYDPGRDPDEQDR